MSWNYNTSLNRVETHLQGMGEIEVEKLVRDADLHNCPKHAAGISMGRTFIWIFRTSPILHP